MPTQAELDQYGSGVYEPWYQNRVDPYEAEVAAIKAAWESARASDAARAEAAIRAIREEAGILDADRQAQIAAEVQYAAASGQISVDRAQQILASIQAKGDANLAALREQGANLLDSLRSQETNSLQQFVQQTLFDLDRNRQITGEGARAGYSGVRRFAVTPTEDQAMAMPQYGAIQQSFAQRRTDAERDLATNTKLTQAMTAADIDRAQGEIGLAQQLMGANVARAGAGGGVTNTARANVEIQKLQEMQAINQREQDARMQQQLEALERQRQMQAQAQRDRLASGGGGGYRPNPNDLHTAYAQGGVTETASMPGMATVSGGPSSLLDLARLTAARQRRMRMNG